MARPIVASALDQIGEVLEHERTALLVQSGADYYRSRVEEVEPEIDSLCDGRILQRAGGLIRYKPSSELRDQVSEFVDACQDRGRRLALIALVLHRIGRGQDETS